jgi:hypothetical protein
MPKINPATVAPADWCACDSADVGFLELLDDELSVVFDRARRE